MLVKAGYNTQQIRSFQLGQAPPQLMTQMGRVIGGRLVNGNGGGPLPQSPPAAQILSGARDPFTGGAARDPFTGGASRGSGTGGLASVIAKTAGRGETLAGRIGDLATRSGTAILKGALGDLGIGNNRQRDAGKARVTGKRGGGSSTGLDDIGYTPEEFQQPNFEYRDFSGQAGEQVGGVYAPRYRAIDEAAGRANEHYKRSDTLTAGLYQALSDNIAKIAAGSAARYAAAGQDQTARTNQLVQDTGQNYSSTQQQEAALLEEMGQQEAAREVLGDNSAEQAYQQGQAQRLGEAQQGALIQQGQTQQDYTSNVANADATAGVVARQNLIHNLGNTLSGFEQDRFNLQGDQAQATLQLGQQLSDRDFARQQAQYGAYSDAYGANNQNQQFLANLGLQKAQMGQQQQQFLYEQQMNQGRNAQQQANLDRQFELDSAKYGTDLATALAEQRLAQQKMDSQGQQGLEFQNQDPVTRVIGQISSATGGNQSMAKDYYDFVRSATSAAAASGEDPAALAGNMFQFVDYIKRAAQAKGMDPLVAQAAASSFWSNFLGKK
jgi:hypothetical protein